MREIDDEQATAAYIGKPPRTLSQWRYLGKGPAYIKAGHAVRYRKADVDRWLSEQTITPSSAA